MPKKSKKNAEEDVKIVPRKKFAEVYKTLPEEKKDKLIKFFSELNRWDLSETEHHVREFNKMHPSDVSPRMEYTMHEIRPYTYYLYDMNKVEQKDFEFFADNFERDRYNKDFFGDAEMMRHLGHIGVNLDTLENGFKILNEDFGMKMKLDSFEKCKNEEFYKIKPEPTVVYDIPEVHLPDKDEWEKTYNKEVEPSHIKNAVYLEPSELSMYSKNMQMKVLADSINTLKWCGPAMYENYYLFNRTNEHLNKLKNIGKSPESEGGKEAYDDIAGFAGFLMSGNNLELLNKKFWGSFKTRKAFQNMVYTMDNLFGTKIMEG